MPRVAFSAIPEWAPQQTHGVGDWQGVPDWPLPHRMTWAG